MPSTIRKKIWHGPQPFLSWTVPGHGPCLAGTGTTQGYIQDFWRKLRRKSLDRLRPKIAKILRLINTPLADIICDHALPRLPVASLLRLRSVSISWDYIISSPIFVDRLRAKIVEILRLINTPLADIIRDHALPRLPVASLLRFLSVSVSWDHIISSPIFALTQSHCHRSISGIFSSATPSCPLFEPFDPVSHTLPDPSLSFLAAPRSSSDPHPTASSAASPLFPLHSYFVCNPGLMGRAGPACLPCRVCLSRISPGPSRAVPDLEVRQAWSAGQTFQV